MGDVVVQTNRPEAILPPAELVRTIIPRQGERLDRLGINEGQDRPETRSEHRLPTDQTIQVVGRYPVLPIPTPPRIPAALPFDFDDQVGPEAGIEQEVGVLQSIFAEDGPFGLVNGHAGDPQRADKPFEGRLVMVGSLGHRRRDRGITLGSGTGIGAASGRRRW